MKKVKKKKTKRYKNIHYLFHSIYQAILHRSSLPM